MRPWHAVSLWIHNNFFLITLFFAAFLVALDNYTGGAAVIIAAALGFVLRHLVRDPRPKQGHAPASDEYGFPSGHAAVSAAFAFALMQTPLFMPALALCIFIILTRLHLRAHSLPQVIGGFLLGCAIAIVANGR